MAEIDFDHLNDSGFAETDMRGRLQPLMTIAGGVTSVALILGMVVWGYQLAMRDVNGIPVLRAAQEPQRIAPQDPGGENIAHQGLTVNAVAAVGGVAQVPETLRLAPAPTELTEEDKPGMGALVASDLGPADLEDGASLQAAETGQDVLSPIEVAPQEDVAELALGLAEEAVSTLDPEAAQADAVEAALALALGEAVDGSGAASEGAILSSPRPMARRLAGEAGLNAQVENVATVAAPAMADELDAESLPAGTLLVQIGAFDDHEAAADAWSRMVTKFGELMVGKLMVVQEATSGGQAFYRLRAHGFADDDDARRFCAALLAEGASCLPVIQR